MGLSIDTSSTATDVEEPALVVSFGSTANKRRPLNKPATLIGRNRGCDLRLDAPEVSGVHCIISRHDAGLTIRDCDTRSGVIVNGQPVRDAELRNGDAVQIGPFSFVVSIPVAPSISTVAPSPTDDSVKQVHDLSEQNKCLHHHIANVEAERDRLAAQLNQARADLAVRESTERTEEILSRQVQSLRAQVEGLEKSLQTVSEQRDRMRSEYDALRAENVTKAQAADAAFEDRLVWMERELSEMTGDRDRLRADLEVVHHSSRQVTDEFAALQKTHQELRDQVKSLSAERDALQKQIDAHATQREGHSGEIEIVQTQLTELMERLSQEEVEKTRLRQSVEESARVQRQWEAECETARNEAQGWRTAAEDIEKKLRVSSEEWNRQIEGMSAERDALRDALQAAQDKVSAAPDVSNDLVQFQERLSGLAQERDALRQELDELRVASSSMVSIKIEALQEEMNTVVARLQDAERQRADVEQRLAAEHHQNEQRLTILRQQLDQERMQLKQLVMQAAQQHDTTQSEMESLRAQLSGFRPSDFAAENEVETLRNRIAELEAQTAEKSEGLPTDLAAYEAQLNQYRFDLETAQGELQEREQEVEVQRSEVVERLKQMELELSRERASIARERSEIERIRREYLAEMEHSQREAETRAKLAPVEQLAQEVKGRVQDVPAPTGLSLRLKNLIRRVSDSEK